MHTALLSHNITTQQLLQVSAPKYVGPGVL